MCLSVSIIQNAYCQFTCLQYSNEIKQEKKSEKKCCKAHSLNKPQYIHASSMCCVCYVGSDSMHSIALTECSGKASGHLKRAQGSVQRVQGSVNVSFHLPKSLF